MSKLSYNPLPSTTQIQLVVDGMTQDIESAIIQKYIADNYQMAVESVLIKEDKITEFIQELRKETEDSETEFEHSCFKLSDTNNSNFYEQKSPEQSKKWYVRTRPRADNVLSCYLYGGTTKLAEKMYNIFKKFEHNSTDVGVIIQVLTLNANGSINSSDVIKEVEDFDNISTSYYPYLDIDEMFREFAISKDKLLVLSAEPGTGKTKIIDLGLKFAITNPTLFGYEPEDVEDGIDIRAAYIKNTDMLSMDSFWSHLNDAEYDFVILDDIDHMLVSRNSQVVTSDDINRKKFINQFLSFTDGIFNKATKFIITTNQEVASIDSAILRKGRCFDILQLRKLSKDEAKIIWLENDLKEKDFEKEFGKTDESILACDIGSKVQTYINRAKKGVTPKPYILEEGISIYSKSGSKKIKIGGK